MPFLNSRAPGSTRSCARMCSRRVPPTGRGAACVSRCARLGRRPRAGVRAVDDPRPAGPVHVRGRTGSGPQATGAALPGLADCRPRTACRRTGSRRGCPPEWTPTATARRARPHMKAASSPRSGRARATGHRRDQQATGWSGTAAVRSRRHRHRRGLPPPRPDPSRASPGGGGKRPQPLRSDKIVLRGCGPGCRDGAYQARLTFSPFTTNHASTAASSSTTATRTARRRPRPRA